MALTWEVILVSGVGGGQPKNTPKIRDFSAMIIGNPWKYPSGVGAPLSGGLAGGWGVVSP